MSGASSGRRAHGQRNNSAVYGGTERAAVNHSIGSRPGMGDREGPLTECQAAAVTYRDSLGLATFADAHAVWLSVPADRAAISITAPLAGVVFDALQGTGID